MLRKTITILCLIIGLKSASGQGMDAYVHQGEVGIGIGVGHDFGDLNPSSAVNRPKTAAGIFFRKQVTNYIGIRLSGDYALLGYSDIYSTNPVQQARNLSFINIWEISISGDFNFFEFHPGFEEYRFTPYMGLGIGVFSYDPYAHPGGEKYLLRTLGTEGQGSSLYPNLQPYNPIAISIPFTLGVKYALNDKTNVFGEICYRFTSTDYLDDVSGLYAPDAFPPLPDGSPSPAFLLQDRSYETGTSLGIKGRQEGTACRKMLLPLSK